MLYLPAGQSLQCVAPVGTPLPSVSVLELAVKCPAVHVLQALPALENRPTAQLVHALKAVLPAAADLPATQLMQELWLVLPW